MKNTIDHSVLLRWGYFRDVGSNISQSRGMLHLVTNTEK